MLIVLVVILGLAVLLASVMLKSANKAAEKIEQKTDTVLSGSEKGAPGSICSSGEDCQSGSCDNYEGKCN